MIGIDVLSGRPAAILAFPTAGDRRPRPAPGLDEPRGEILFFTGVRYERLREPAVEELREEIWPADGLACDQHRFS